MTCGMMTCEMNNLGDRVKFVFSPDVIPVSYTHLTLPTTAEV